MPTVPPAPADLDIRPLTPETWDALAALFAEGGDPARCWCIFYRDRASGASPAQAPGNRQRLQELTNTQAAEGGVAPGLVALRDGRAVGWVSVGPREDYDRLEHSRVMARVDDRPVWAVVCFVVSKAARGQGVGGALLEAAAQYAREHGATLLEGYPIETEGKRVSSASAYNGTRGMFERAGFEVVTTRRAAPNARPRHVVRRALEG